ncbi:MAG: Asp-tRNA(Asn)/Glu-tRNA(Gln) amidotransferase subunit GatC [Candidatus Paceibacterota bacterium]
MSEKNIKINKELIDKLAKLSRLDVKEDVDGLVDDFKKIISYFDELKNLNISEVNPMTGGTDNKNVFREDKLREGELSKNETVDQFPEKKDGFLRVPPIFSD